MIGFWIMAAAMMAAVMLGFWRWSRFEAAQQAVPYLDVYRRQLAEIDRDSARGLVAAPEAERLRTEISRRILDHDRQTHKNSAHSGRLGIMAWALVAVVMSGAGVIYWRIGAVGYADMPYHQRLADAETWRITRPKQTEIEAKIAESRAERNENSIEQNIDPEYLALIAKLRQKAAERPNDVQGQQLLARSEANLGQFIAAYQAQRQVIALKGDQATANDHAILAEYMIFATNLYVSPEAEAELKVALQKDIQNTKARYYVGMMFNQIGRPDLGFIEWRRLLEQAKGDENWLPALRRDIGPLAQRAGVRYNMPPAGPDADDMADAADMSDAERKEMIAGMVEGLRRRLANEGGSAEEWAKLIGAYGVLGQKDRAQMILDEAKTRFAPYPDDMALIRAAAEKAGLAP